MNASIYVVPFRVNSFQIPTRVQVLYARDYCLTNNIPFSFPQSDSVLQDNCPIFSSLLAVSTDIIMFSIMNIGSSHVSEMMSSMTLMGKWPQDLRFHFTYDNRCLSFHSLICELEMIDRFRLLDRWFACLRNRSLAPEDTYTTSNE